jgi:carboxyl-terminal processing protease
MWARRPLSEVCCASVVVLAFLGTVCPGTIRAQAQPRTIALRRLPTYQETFDKIHKTVRDRFYDRELHGVNWERIGQKYRAQLNMVDSKAAFGALINRMLDELRASHAEYFTDDELGFYMLPSVMQGDMEGRRVAHIGIMGRYEKDGYYVTGVLDGGPAQKAGVLYGDRLLRVDDKPFSTVGSFRGKEGQTVRLELRREGTAEPLRLEVTPVKENLLTAFLNATRRSATVLNVKGKRIGYVHLWTMAAEPFRIALEQLVLGKLYDTDGLILDLRDGFGGRPFGYGNVFFQPDIIWESSVRGGTPIPQRIGYDKPMVVLINNGTRSAKEFFTYQFKKSKRGVVVGTTTAGAFLGAGSFSIHEEGLLELPVVGLRIDGIRLEGTGVAPDIAVEPVALYTDKDSQMARAKQVLLDLIRGATP